MQFRRSKHMKKCQITQILWKSCKGFECSVTKLAILRTHRTHSDIHLHYNSQNFWFTKQI